MSFKKYLFFVLLCSIIYNVSVGADDHTDVALDLGMLEFNELKIDDHTINRLSTGIFDATDLKSKADEMLNYGLSDCTYTVMDLKGHSVLDYKYQDEDWGEHTRVQEYKAIEFVNDDGLLVVGVYIARNSTYTENDVFSEFNMVYYDEDIEINKILPLFMSDGIANYLLNSDEGDFSEDVIFDSNIDNSLVKVYKGISNNTITFGVSCDKNFIYYSDTKDLDYSSFKYLDFFGEGIIGYCSDIIDKVYDTDIVGVPEAFYYEGYESGAPIDIDYRVLSAMRLMNMDGDLEYTYSVTPYINEEDLNSSLFSFVYSVSEIKGKPVLSNFELFFRDTKLFADEDRAKDAANIISNALFDVDFDENNTLVSNKVLGEKFNVKGFYDYYHLEVSSAEDN